MDISTSYLGLELKSPLVPSASPLSQNLDNIRLMEDVGAGAVVMHSLFEEQINIASIEVDHYLSHGAESYGEALSYFPEMDSYEVGPETYLEHIAKAKSKVDMPVIASLNGISSGGWTKYAALMQQAGADAIELNMYYIPTDPDLSSAEVETMYLKTLRRVCEKVHIPVSVKLSPFFSSIPNIAKKMTGLGAKGLVMFNRFYQPDLDIELFEVTPNLTLSTSDELRLPLRWTAILYKRIQADIAITGGVHSATDVVKGLLAGANITMMAAELLKNGIHRIADIESDLRDWMEQNEYSSVSQMRGSMSQINTKEPAAFERANYMKVLRSIQQDPTGKLWW